MVLLPYGSNFLFKYCNQKEFLDKNIVKSNSSTILMIMKFLACCDS